MKPEQRDRIIVGTVICGSALLFIAVIVILAWRFGCYAVVCCRCCADGSVYKADNAPQQSRRPTRSLGANILDGDDLIQKEETVAVRVESSFATSPSESFDHHEEQRGN